MAQEMEKRGEIMKEYEVYSEYWEGTKTAKVVRHNEHKYWGVHLSDSTSDNDGFLMWHPTKSEYWCEDIAENFCQGMVREDGSVRDNMYYVRGLYKA